MNIHTSSKSRPCFQELGNPDSIFNEAALPLVLGTIASLGAILTSLLLFPELGYGAWAIAGITAVLEAGVMGGLLHTALGSVQKSREKVALAVSRTAVTPPLEKAKYKEQLEEKDKALQEEVSKAVKAKEPQLSSEIKDSVQLLLEEVALREAASKRAFEEVDAKCTEAKSEALKILARAQEQGEAFKQASLESLPGKQKEAEEELARLQASSQQLEEAHGALEELVLLEFPYKNVKDVLYLKRNQDLVFVCKNGEVKTNSLLLKQVSIEVATCDQQKICTIKEFDVEVVQLFIDTLARDKRYRSLEDIDLLKFGWELASQLACEKIARKFEKQLLSLLNKTTVFKFLEKRGLPPQCERGALTVLATNFSKLHEEARQSENHPLEQIPLDIVIALLKREDLSVEAEVDLLYFLNAWAAVQCQDDQEKAKAFLSGSNEKNINLYLLVHLETLIPRELTLLEDEPEIYQAYLSYSETGDEERLKSLGLPFNRTSRPSVEEKWWGTWNILSHDSWFTGRLYCPRARLRNRLLAGPIQSQVFEMGGASGRIEISGDKGKVDVTLKMTINDKREYAQFQWDVKCFKIKSRGEEYLTAPCIEGEMITFQERFNYDQIPPYASMQFQLINRFRRGNE